MVTRLSAWGDSLTAQSGSYRVPLNSRLIPNVVTLSGLTWVGQQNAEPQVIEGIAQSLWHEGHAGARVSHFLTGVAPSGLLISPEVLMATNPADIVMLFIGINDIIADRAGETIAEDIGTLMDRTWTISPNTKFIVVSPTPFRNGGIYDNAARRAEHVKLHTTLSTVVFNRQKQGRELTFVDAYTNYSQDRFSDDVHPDAEGYDLVAGLVFTAIRSYFTKRDMIERSPPPSAAARSGNYGNQQATLAAYFNAGLDGLTPPRSGRMREQRSVTIEEWTPKPRRRGG